jgi:hypothetical protein
VRINELAVVEMHVPLRCRDIHVTEQTPGVLDPLLAADFPGGPISRELWNLLQIFRISSVEMP